MNLRQRLITLAARALGVTVRIDDKNQDGWTAYGSRAHDRSTAEMDLLYSNILEAWRKNPIAWHTVAITTDYVIGDGITLSSQNDDLQRFITAFWSHPKNLIKNRLESMCNELTRAGDLLPLLFRNPKDGMSYVRFLTKDQIAEVKLKANDWETELWFVQKPDANMDQQRWHTPDSGYAPRSKAVILHYHINRPIGATWGESDLAAIEPWLKRYSRLLEGRIRLHWAARAFLWIVTVPGRMVKSKQEQYDTPPEPGSIIVKDESEEWSAVSPQLRGSDAAHDMKAVRGMIDAGTGYPPHWRGEGEDVNVATATAMQRPAERHLKRRREYFAFILMDLTFHAYQRAHELFPDRWPELPRAGYEQLFTVSTTDISTDDNKDLAEAAREMTTVYKELVAELPSNRLKRLLLRLVLKFANEPQADEFLDQVMQEAEAATATAGPAESNDAARAPIAESDDTLEETAARNGAHP